MVWRFLKKKNKNFMIFFWNPFLILCCQNVPRESKKQQNNEAWTHTDIRKLTGAFYQGQPDFTLLTVLIGMNGQLWIYFTKSAINGNGYQ